MDYRADELMSVGNRLFEQKKPFDTLCQEIAENFFPERAHFTTTRSVGDSFADNLTSSYPIMARRDLGNSLGTMLRPRDKQWFFQRVRNYDESNSIEAARWLEWATKLQRNAMYDRESNFVRATKEGDHDYAAFGQCAITTEMNWDGPSLLFTCKHLKNLVWCEGLSGRIDRVDEKIDNMTVRDMMRRFPKGNIHPSVERCYNSNNADDKYKEIPCRRIVLRSEDYESSHKDSKTGKYKRYPQPYVSIYIDLENDNIIEEVGSWTKVYTIPRWQTVSESQYSYSPATVAALPDARLYQQIALTILEAGEKYVNPPMIAVQEAIRSDVNMFAGGITWADVEYDERLGEVLRPLSQDRGSLPLGFEIQGMIKQSIHEAFFLNKMNLMDRGSAEMTAYETAQRVQEYIRDALPIFEPTEDEYNGSLCEDAFELLMRNGAFGPVENIPEPLQGREIEFKFESPLHSAQDRLKSQQFLNAMGLISQAMGLDPSSANVVNIKEGLRDSIIGSGAPIKWMYSDEESAALDAQASERAESAEMMQMLGQGAEIAKTAGEAGQNLGLVGEEE